MPQTPRATNVRVPGAASAGPPPGPAGRRVSRARHGESVWNLVATGPVTPVVAEMPVLAFQYEPLGVVSSFTARTRYVAASAGRARVGERRPRRRATA